MQKKEIELTEIEKDAIIQVRHLKQEEQKIILSVIKAFYNQEQKNNF